MKRSMRVTGGKYNGRRVACPPGVIRPAMDRMRESVFAILGDLSELSFLDLYSGSGVIGIEAASRGASPVTFVEKDRRKLGTLKKNVEFVEADVTIICLAVERFFLTTKQKYNIVFADPPFNYKEKAGMLAKAGELLTPDGSLLIHYPAEEQIPEKSDGLVLYDRRKYGRSIVGFYRLSCL
jgi:16S rRNA (guanine(966)-N(2))-methyltransferase RsmD